MSRTWKDAERAIGLAGLHREGGDHERLFPETELRIPHAVDLVDTTAGPALMSHDWPPGKRRGTKGVLEAFVRLADGPPERFAAFARAWGLLGLCPHGMPASHNRPAFPNQPKEFHCRPVSPEPISVWRHYSRQTAALMQIMGKLYRDELPAAEHWRTVYEDSHEAPWWDRDIAAEGIILADVIRELVEMANVRVVPDWDLRKAKLNLELVGTGVFGAIARELAFLAARVDGLAACAECGRFFVPGRRTSPGRRSFCPPCQKNGASHKHAMRDHRARKRAKRS